jgi:UDP-N-acetylglucosamine diphosphorylase / glucose-1-phosphate thymidylyltransferase / UDP-N-acetylgalactosamine diphosphorylase / glucosamine-1-phosphate N-acetyltransferase / galactosamine-1-phosphate N-acetyltransferase
MQIDSILLFEPEETGLLYPFSILHPLWELRCGALRIFEKIQKQFPDARLIYQGRELHMESFLTRFDHQPQDLRKENLLILHSAILPEKQFWDEIELGYEQFLREGIESKSVAFTVNSLPVAVYIHKDELINPSNRDKEFLPKTFDQYGLALPHIEISEPKVIDYLWHALDFNATAIVDDVRHFPNQYDFSTGRKIGAQFINENSIFIGNNVSVGANVVIDASEGPVVIDDSARIMHGSTIIGPCYIGRNSSVKIGAKIYEGCSFGEYCKVGGEIENSIIQSYSNKQHDGFLGHSFIGEWVNLGANTNNSDLKNTYGPIKVSFGRKDINTGRMFLGLLCGDHTKSAINTSFNTGTVCGINSILFYEGFHPQYIPSFSWAGRKDSMAYKVDKAIEIARTVMSRRNRELSAAEEELFRIEHQRTISDSSK